MTSVQVLSDAYRVTPREAKRLILRILKAGRVPFLQSSPAMGKSALILSIAKEFKLKVIDMRLSTSTPEDMNGLAWFEKQYDANGKPLPTKASYIPFDTFPMEGDPIPEGYNGWLLFLDEMNSAAKMVMAAGYKLLLDRMIGQRPIHSKVAIIGAGNLMTDRAIVNALGTAMQSRVIHLEMFLDIDNPKFIEEFAQDVMLPNNWDYRVISYLHRHPTHIWDFDPAHNNKTFSAPRTWDFLQSTIKGETYDFVKDPNGGPDLWTMDRDAPLFAGCITPEKATNFINHCRVFKELPDVKQIIEAPHTVPIPNDSAARWGIISVLFEHIDREGKNLTPFGKYVRNFPREFIVLFWRGVLIRKPDLRRNEAFREAFAEFREWLYDEAT
jgi:hypothetical protein